MPKAPKISKKSKIAVIAGGISDEREISLKSGKNLIAALKRLGYENAFYFEFADNKKSKSSALKSVNELVELKAKKGIDLAFLVTHGKYGEDGCLQGLLEILDIPYTGSRVNASALCMDKLLTKKVMLGCGLPTLPCWFEEIPKVFGEVEGLPIDVEVEDEATEELLQGSFIVKPKDEGSSVGIVKLDDFDDYASDEEFRRAYPNCFVEPFIKGIEITASILEVTDEEVDLIRDRIEKESSGSPYLVLNEGNLISLPLLELRTENEFYDYEAKYTKGKTEFVVPAELEPEHAQIMHELALDAFKAAECSGFARVDFIVGFNESHYPGPQILEINTLPGMTDISDMPAQAKAAFLSYDELVEMILSKAR